MADWKLPRDKMPELSDEEMARVIPSGWIKESHRAIAKAQRKLLKGWVNPYELSEWAQKNLCYEDLHKLIGWLEQGDAKDTS